MFVGFSAILIFTKTFFSYLSDITIVSSNYSSHLVVNNVTGSTKYSCSAKNAVAPTRDANCAVTVIKLGKTSCSFALLKLNTLPRK